MNRVRWAPALLAGLVMLLPAPARADNTVCSAPIVVVPDGSVYNGTMTAPAQARWFTFRAKADRSYAVSVDNLTPTDINQAFSLSITGTCGGFSLPPGIVLRQNLSVVEPVIWNDPSFSESRMTLTTTADGPIVIEVFDLTAGSVGSFSLRVEDTTQINTFFSTFGGFETFYRFTNTTNMDLQVRLKMVSDAGAVVRDFGFTIPPNRSAPTLNTTGTSLVVPANLAGFAIITHDGPPNALAADAFLSGHGVVLPLKIVDARQKR
jgi:hypothetical protein